MTKLHLILWRKFILALIITLISEKDAIEEFVLKSTSPKYTYRTEWYDQQVRIFLCSPEFGSQIIKLEDQVF